MSKYFNLPGQSERNMTNRGVVSVGSVGSMEPTDFWKVGNGTHGFFRERGVRTSKVPSYVKA